MKRKFVLTDNGRVLIIPEGRKWSKERRVLRKLKRDLDTGSTTIEKIQNHYECWISGLMLLDCRKRIREMDEFFKATFGVKPTYKCKRKSRRKKKC